MSAGIVTGWASMMSATVMPSMRSVNAVGTTGGAGRLRDEAADHRQPEAVEEVAAGREEDADADEQVGEALADASRDAGGAIAVAGDPPHDGARDAAAVEGKGGDEVEDEQHEVDRRQRAEQRERRRGLLVAGQAARRRRGAALTSALMATKITTRTSVTTGPATAILNSAPGDVVSRAIFATPPNSQRSMPLISMPSRRATSAWPSSCMTSETKNRNTAVTATTYACVTEPAEHVAEVVRREVDEDEEDDEPARAGPDPDAEDPHELNRRAANEHRGILSCRLGLLLPGSRAAGRAVRTHTLRRPAGSPRRWRFAIPTRRN